LKIINPEKKDFQLFTAKDIRHKRTISDSKPQTQKTLITPVKNTKKLTFTTHGDRFIIGPSCGLTSITIKDGPISIPQIHNEASIYRSPTDSPNDSIARKPKAQKNLNNLNMDKYMASIRPDTMLKAPERPIPKHLGHTSLNPTSSVSLDGKGSKTNKTILRDYFMNKFGGGICKDENRFSTDNIYTGDYSKKFPGDRKTSTEDKYNWASKDFIVQNPPGITRDSERDRQLRISVQQDSLAEDRSNSPPRNDLNFEGKKTYPGQKSFHMNYNSTNQQGSQMQNSGVTQKQGKCFLQPHNLTEDFMSRGGRSSTPLKPTRDNSNSKTTTHQRRISHVYNEIGPRAPMTTKAPKIVIKAPQKQPPGDFMQKQIEQNTIQNGDHHYKKKDETINNVREEWYHKVKRMRQRMHERGN
jgi:hypothetical protein